MPGTRVSLTPQGDLGTASSWRCVLGTLAAARGTGSGQHPKLCLVTGQGMGWGQIREGGAVPRKQGTALTPPPHPGVCLLFLPLGLPVWSPLSGSSAPFLPLPCRLLLLGDLLLTLPYLQVFALDQLCSPQILASGIKKGLGMLGFCAQAERGSGALGHLLSV